MSSTERQAVLFGIKRLKIQSARKYVPAAAIVGRKFSFGTLYYYGADNYFVPKQGWKVKAGGPL